MYSEALKLKLTSTLKVTDCCLLSCQDWTGRGAHT